MTADTTVPAEFLPYPMARDTACPFDPPADALNLLTTAPITRVRIWDGSTPWLISRHEDARAILTDSRFSSDASRPGFPAASQASLSRRRAAPTFLVMDGAAHARQRRMLIGEFTVRRIDQLRPAVAEITNSLLDQMAQLTPPADLVENFALPLPSIVISRMLGVPYSHHDFFQSRSRLLMSIGATKAQAEEASNELLDFITDLVADREIQPTDDLIGRLARRVTDGELEQKEAASLALQLLIGGHETTANMIGLGAMALIEHQPFAEVFRTGDETVIAAGVEELLRLLSVAHLGRRRVALEDVDFAGARIRAGEGVIVAGELSNRDPAVFDEPDKLNFDRPSNHHMAFGFGPHQCIGQSLARLELQVCYPLLLRRFPSLRVAVPYDQLRLRDQMVVYGLHELPVAW
jgi:cytochrome P450